tara:strand:+ start:305 stop:505 length:201 start_codon:yes stop_codon:yes gene_type:complete
MGKGSKERLRSISYKEYTRRWEAVFSIKEAEWDETRINIIGKNGNDGLHYEDIEEDCPCDKDKCCE